MFVDSERRILSSPNEIKSNRSVRKISAAERQRGRIHPHQRNTDDAGDLLGANLELPEDFKAKFQETIKHDITDKCRADYRNRLKRIMKFWKEETPDMYAVGVVDVSELDQYNKSK